MPSMPLKARRNWTDVAGFIFYFALAVSILLRLPRIGILLLPAVLHESLVAASFLLRRPLRGHLRGIGPRVAGYSGTFLLLIFFDLASKFRPAWLVASGYMPMRTAGAALWICGSLLGLSTVWWLRKAFSIEPQARTLVTSGPFRFARHPTYGSYILQYGGVWLINPTLPIGIVLLVWLGMTCLRVHYEEQVLSSTFPEYQEYRARVGAFGFKLRHAPAAVPEQPAAAAVAAGQEHAA